MMEQTNLKLSILPLRPSTLAILLREGFTSTNDVYSSSKPGSGGIKNFAVELNIKSLPEAMRILREVENASKLSNRNDNASYRSDSGRMNQQQSDQNNTIPAHPNSNVNTSSTHLQNNTPSTNTISHPSTQSAASLLLLAHKRERAIITCARAVDTLLGGGIQRGEVTEIVGLPGVGKTQLCIQLCVDTALPREYGGVEGHSIYIDSEGSFSPERCLEISSHMVEHVKATYQRRQQQKQRNSNDQHSYKRQRISTHVDYPSNQSFTEESILDSINIFRVHDETCQTATIMSLPQILQNMKNEGKDVKLIVIDSIAFHYRVRVIQYQSKHHILIVL